MGYLQNHDINFEPVDIWPVKETSSYMAKRSPFRAAWSDTLRLLDRELSALGAKRVLIRCYLDRSRIRQDGAPRSDARMHRPGIILSFDSRHGPISLPCDKFDDWRDNLRAIALSLEALRKVDRYGVTNRAEQYRGWQALPAPGFSPGDEIKTRADALAFLRKVIGGRADILPPDDAIREAQFATHPDKSNGNGDAFKRVMKCERILKST